MDGLLDECLPTVHNAGEGGKRMTVKIPATCAAAPATSTWSGRRSARTVRGRAGREAENKEQAPTSLFPACAFPDNVSVATLRLLFDEYGSD